jgi:catechol 2,3-dioxygenase-like lactoylglutathione lyase family enzyme
MTNLDVKRLDHVSYTVSDLDRSVDFYAKFGYEPVNRYAASGPELDVAVATENADMDIQVMRRPDGGMLELISYVRQPSERAARNSVVGAAHLAFVVGDIQAAYEELTAEGVEFLSKPNTDRYGERWVYFRDPDGITVELMQPNADSRRAVSH